MSSMVKKPGRAVKKTRRSKPAKAVNPPPAAGVPAVFPKVEEPVLPQAFSPEVEAPRDSGHKASGNPASGAQSGPAAVPPLPPEEEASGPVAQIEEKCEFLGFFMNQEEYAIPISQIKEIIRPAEMTVIPGSPPILLGIISLRGVIIPVFKVSNRLAGLKAPEDLKTVERGNERLNRIIIIQIEQGVLGLMVDGVTDVIKIREETIQSPPSLLNQTGRDVIRGITRFKNRLVILLFIERIVDVIQEEIRKVRKS